MMSRVEWGKDARLMSHGRNRLTYQAGLDLFLSEDGVLTFQPLGVRGAITNGCTMQMPVEKVDDLIAGLVDLKREASGETRAVRRMVEELEAGGVGPEKMDILVMDLGSGRESQINNGGLEAKVRFVVEEVGTAAAQEAIEQALRPINFRFKKGA